jgi:hypothetical protein
MAEKQIKLEPLLNRAKNQEMQYDWSGAVKTYDDALRTSSGQDPFLIADTLERKAYSLHKAAFQSKTNVEFIEGVKKAIWSYKEAKKSYEKIEGIESEARIFRSDAMMSYLEYWQKDKASEKRSLIRTAWGQTIEALKKLKSSNSALEYARTFNHLWFCAAMLFNYAPDFEGRKKPVMEALGHGERTIKFLDGSGEPEELTMALVRIGILERAAGSWLVDMEEVDLHYQKSYDYWCRAKEMSENVAFAELGWCNALAGMSVDLSYEPAKELPVYMEALPHSRRTRDKLLMGCLLEIIAYAVGWNVYGIEDPEKRESASNEALKHALGARDEFIVVSFQSPNWTTYWAGFPSMGHISSLALTEIDVKKKRELLESALAQSPEHARLARATEYPALEQSALFILARTLTELAKTEHKGEVRRKMLQQALDAGKRQLALEERYDPYHFINLSFSIDLLADLLFEIAKATDDRETKTRLLREAVQYDARAFEIFTKGMTRWGGSDLSIISMGSDGYLDYGRRLRLLSQLTNDTKVLKEAAETFERSVELALKADLWARAAENNWEAAKTYDFLQEYQKSSEKFDMASDNYRKATEKTPSLKGFYKDFIVYMSAWAEIERAKYSHARLDSEAAMKHYEKAASLHRSTDKWAYLSSNYAAWAEIERGEDLSRKEHPAEAVKAFENSIRLFDEATKSLETERPTIIESGEKDMVDRLIKAAENRRRYCRARVTLETAKILGRQGDNHASSVKYSQTAEMFQKIHDQLESEQDRKELLLIIKLSKAWQEMARAEADGSAEAYAEASVLFEHAKDLSPGEKAKALALGHSRFCKALEAGTLFADARDPALHALAIKHLDSAASHYARAGVESASEYSRASKLLFDAYAAMDRASQEENHEKKAKAYLAVEKILEASAASFEQAEQPGKKDQVLRLRESVKRERELAISITELFRAPLVVSSTTSFASPTPTYEQPVGLERFEHADVQANLIASKKELKLDEDLELDIELINAGRGPAKLIKLQDPVPRGFTLLQEPEGYRMEDSFLNLRGKRLDPLKTEEIRLALKSVQRGHFALKPRILYLDESGGYKSHEPEPMRVTVGIEEKAPQEKVVPADPRVAAEARSLLAGLNVVTLSHYCIVGNYVRYGEAVRSDLKDARQKIVAACRSPSPKRENYIIWAPPGSGKTYFVQEVASLLGETIRYRELNLAKLDEAGFRSGLAELRNIPGPWLCLVDEVDAKPDEPWPYEALLPFLDASATEGARFVLVLAGSSGSSLEEMKKAIASRPKGPDMLSRVPNENEYSIPSMGVGDRMLVVLSQFRQAGRQMGREVREVEKLGLYYVALNPRLSNARQLREFAVRCAERVLPGDDRLKYDSLFHPGDLENKIFWTQALQSAGALVGSFLLVED